ncbi:MAG: UPF0147 family protein [Candidatus Bathyarchaeia archaeon]
MSRKKQKLEEYEQRIKSVLEVLKAISEDTTTPRNIRRAAKNSIDMLMNTSLTQAVRSANTISILDEISQDPNMPPYTRTRIWNILSILETIKD